MAFGGIKPGDFRKNLIYNKDRTYAFVMALGDVTDEWYANAAGAINWGFPTIADTPIPEVLPTGICTYEHVVSNIPHAQITEKAVEVRGLKVQVAEGSRSPSPTVPPSKGKGSGAKISIWSGRRQDRRRRMDHLQERMEEVEDGRVEVIGPDVDKT